MTDTARPYEILRPERQLAPLVFASPHSGRDYPEDFLAAARLDPLALRRSEDSFVDEIFAAAPALGAPLLKARFPRAYIDPNREPYELDPSMFSGPLPGHVNAHSPRVAAGLGTIARVVAGGAEIYAGKLEVAAALERIERCYHPYHRALAELVAETRRRFGFCILIDCHSMPSIGGPPGSQAATQEIDFVLGDCYGTSCEQAVSQTAFSTLRAQGYRVARNKPYSGGFVTRHYGRPRHGLHALQIEINRALYMDEQAIRRAPGLALLSERMGDLITALAGLRLGRLAAE
jgi:N-formylglutamate amidohydrolase